MGKLGIVVGMLSEARIAQRAGCAVAVGGGGPLGARRMAERLVADGARMLVSFGLAAGLDPAIPAGTALLPKAVLCRDRLHPCDPDMLSALHGAGEPVDLILAGDRIIATAREKARLWQETRAAALDLESGMVAEVAEAEGVPFAVVRAVCDPAGRDLPRAAVEALNESGGINSRAMALNLLRRPSDIFGLIMLGRDAARARRALIRGAESLGAFAAGDAHLRRGLGL